MGYGQHTLNASGGSASTASGSVDYSVGQLATSTDSSSGGSVTEGLQQPYEILVVSSLPGTENISLKAFPNPVTDYLKLISAEQNTTLAYRIYGLSGVLKDVGKWAANEVIIETDTWEPGIYLVEVSDRNLVIKTFKLIKK